MIGARALIDPDELKVLKAAAETVLGLYQMVEQQGVVQLVPGFMTEAGAQKLYHAQATAVASLFDAERRN